MKALVHQKIEGLKGVELVDMVESQPGNGQVKVRLKTAGLNRRDLLVTHRHKKEDPALILGSDGTGIVEEIGAGVKGVQVGDEVVINPSLGWPVRSDAPPPGFEILGLPDHGTFAETIIIPAENVEPKPKHLTWEEAGVLPLASLTAYRALVTRGNIQSNQSVLLPGVGSGVITFILQMAKAVGARVIVTSRHAEKREKALQLGADVAIDSAGDWNEALHGEKVDLVIESVGAATWDKSLGQLRPGGTIVTFGATTGDEVTFNLRSFFYGQYNLLGSTMGSSEEFRDMLRFVEKHNIKPVLDKVYPLAEGKAALERLKNTDNFGKVALSISE